MVAGVPSKRISPASGRTSPYTTFMSVDLPAPFSPSRAWTWPQSTTRSTPSLALSPPKVLTIPRSSRAARSVAICLCLDSRLEAAVGQLLLDVGDLGLDVSRDL